MKRYFDNLKKNLILKCINIWTNCSITPGTVFMDKLHHSN